MKSSNRTSKRSPDKLGLEVAERTGTESRLTRVCSRPLTAAAETSRYAYVVEAE